MKIHNFMVVNLVERYGGFESAAFLVDETPFKGELHPTNSKI
jgi:hypothetical protein